MEKKTGTRRTLIDRPHKILGLRLPYDVVADLKAEAKGRNVSLKVLFMEMWLLYKKSGRSVASVPFTSAHRSVGFNMPSELVIEVKTEASRRGVTPNKLFAEMWLLYKSKRKKSA
jgi:hypothetical protein